MSRKWSEVARLDDIDLKKPRRELVRPFNRPVPRNIAWGRADREEISDNPEKIRGTDDRHRHVERIASEILDHSNNCTGERQCNTGRDTDWELWIAFPLITEIFPDFREVRYRHSTATT